MSEETLLNYFLLFVTFPSLSSRRFSPKGDKPLEPRTAGRCGRPGGETPLEPGSPGMPGPPPPTLTFRESRDQNPQKWSHLSGYTQCAHRPRPQSPAWIRGERGNIPQGVVWLIWAYHLPLGALDGPVGRDSERGPSLSRQARAAENRGRRVG